jgi:hypothetical protein
LAATRHADVRGLGWPLLFAGVTVLAVMLTSLIDFGVDHPRIPLLDANVNSSWSHRASVAALAAGAAVALLATARSIPLRAWWGATAGILILLCLVEASPAHVQVDRLANGKLIYAPLLVVLVVCVWRLLGSSNQAALIRSGLAFLFVSYTIHIFGTAVMDALGWESGSWGYQVKVGLKEGTALAGWLLVVLALWRSPAPRLLTRKRIRNTVLANRPGAASKLARWAIRRRTEPR